MEARTPVVRVSSSSAVDLDVDDVNVRRAAELSGLGRGGRCPHQTGRGQPGDHQSG